MFNEKGNYQYPGDMVKSTYDSNNDGVVNAADTVPWSGVTNTPDTLSGYGIEEVPASVLSGVIGAEHIPPSAVERMKIVENDSMRFALTTADVQNGDTVKVTATNKMYLVVDDGNLDSESGYAVYEAGRAAAVDWTGVENKPATIVNIDTEINNLKSALNFVSNDNSAIVKNVNYDHTVTTSGTWQGQKLIKDFLLSGNEKTITISADAANLYGNSCIVILCYADLAKTTELARYEIGESFNSNPHRGYGIPDGTELIYIQIYLVSGGHNPSVGDVAYIHGLTINYDTFAVNGLMKVPQVDALKSKMVNDGEYKKTSNLLDFGFIGGTWRQGGVSDMYIYKSHTKISVEAGKIIYGTIDADKMKKTSMFSSYTMYLYLVAFDSNNVQITDMELSDTNYQTIGSYYIPNNCSYIYIVLSSKDSSKNITPVLLDNTVEAFAYIGYEPIAHTEIQANYVPLSVDLQNAYSGQDVSLSLCGFLEEKNTSRFGKLYGPISQGYIAQSTSEDWQRKSFAIMDNIPVNGEKYVYAMISERHGLGLRSGVLLFYDSNSSVIYQVEMPVELHDKGPIMFKDIIPDGTVKIFAQFEGISSASSAGTPSVINETYYVNDCYVFVTNDLPDEVSDVFNGEWKQAISEIRENQGTSLCFGIQTDTHFALKDPSYLGTQLKEMTKQVGFDFIANLGDITRGYSGTNIYDNPTNMRKYAEVIMKRYTDGVQCPFLVAIGNHESNISWAIENPNDEKFSLAELYAQYTKQSINTSARIESEPGKSYYYIDLIPARVIVLFTNDATNGGFTVSQNQVAWFTNKALDTDKPVLVLSHVPLVNGWNPDNLNYSSDYANIMTPLEAFKNNGGTVIACVYGHAHRQEAQKKNGIWHIICTRTETKPTTAEFFMVDLDTYNISTIGVGGANSRSFTH